MTGKLTDYVFYDFRAVIRACASASHELHYYNITQNLFSLANINQVFNDSCTCYANVE